MGKSLKEKNRWQIWLIAAANGAAFYVALQAGTFSLSNLTESISAATKLLPLGLAVVVATVINGLLTANAKERLVFLRWHNVLPGHRAFTVYALSDPRIDVARLKKACGNKMPVSPADQNTLWYRFYKTVDNSPAVEQVHGDFLLTRDYTGFAAIFFVCFGLPSLILTTPRAAAIYISLLGLQFLFVRYAAATYGIRFVQTVLAQKSAAQK